MSVALRVRLRPASGSGRLRPRYDAEADLLEVGSAIRREWPYGVDIDGRVIFDLDRDRVLANFDLLIPRRLWQLAEEMAAPQAARAADLEFEAETVAKKSFHLPVRVRTNSSKSCAVISFGHNGGSGSAVELSGDCYAFVDSGVLTGFFIRIGVA